MRNPIDTIDGARPVEHAGNKTNSNTKIQPKNKFLPGIQRNLRKIPHLEQRAGKFHSRLLVEITLIGVKKTKRFLLNATNLTETRKESTLLTAQVAQGKLISSRRGPLRWR
jgi:hypothetical protein